MQKYRQKYGQFTVEGRKGVDELIHSDHVIHTILVTAAYLEKYPDTRYDECVDEQVYRQLTGFSTPPGILAVANTRVFTLADIDWNQKLTLALDAIADPGNLGTIIRTADWFGVSQVLLGKGCTDFYNAKTLAATMGSFTRCRAVQADLADVLRGKQTYGCFLKGADIHKVQLKGPSVLVIGSESHGISPETEALIQYPVTIPGKGNAESLNASVAAAIAMDNLMR